MGRDMREIVREHKDDKVKLSAQHRDVFQQKLMQELHKEDVVGKKSNLLWLSIAASIALIISVSINFYTVSSSDPSETIPTESSNTTEEISLGSISPELKSVETYYTNTINYELSQLELTKDNKELFDGYLLQLKELTDEYKSLTKELNNKGVNDDTINALIGNLQLRLQLLKRMRKQLNEFKKINKNEVQAI